MAGKAVPTRYSGLSRGEVDLLFSTESWASMGAASRVEACQELENRLAEADGTIPRSVMTEPMSGAGCQGQAGKTDHDDVVVFYGWSRCYY